MGGPCLLGNLPSGKNIQKISIGNLEMALSRSALNIHNLTTTPPGSRGVMQSDP